MRSPLSVLLLFLTIASSAQVGNPFPTMESESLTNQMVSLPNDIKGKFTIIGLAYTKASEDDLKTWFEPAYNQFIYKPEKPSIFDITYDVHCFFVPMFTGAKRPAYQKVMKKLQKTIDKRLQPHVLFYQGAIKEYKQALAFNKGRDVPYFFVIDPDGKIVYTTSGKYTTKKMQEIVEAVDAALGME